MPKMPTMPKKPTLPKKPQLPKMPARKKKESEYHTGRLNISCPPSVKDAIATDATAHGQSISQFILELHEKSTQAGTAEHLAHLGLDVVGIKKRLVDIDTRLRKSLARSQGTLDAGVAEDLRQLRELECDCDVILKETLDAVRLLKAREEDR